MGKLAEKHHCDFAFMRQGRLAAFVELCPGKGGYLKSALKYWGVPYVYFWPDRPNTPHYIVRKTLEALGKL